MSATATQPETWTIIKASIDELNREELEKRFWKLYDEMSFIPVKEHPEVWERELKYINNRLKS